MITRDGVSRLIKPAAADKGGMAQADQAFGST